MRPIIGLCSLLLVVSACHTGGTRNATVRSTQSPPPVELISNKNIFNKDSVHAILVKRDLLAELQAKKIFLKAVDLFRNQKNANASIEFFEKSLRIWPGAKTYYELGNALMDAKEYTHSIDAYTMADYLEFKPRANCHYNIACANSMMGETSDALRYLSMALDEGYDNKNQLLYDTDLDSIRTTNEYKELMLHHLKGKKTRLVMFSTFLATFPELKSDYKRGFEEVGQYNLGDYISYDYASFIPGMEDNRFSRDVSNEYQVVGKKEITNGNKLIAYSAIQAIADTMVPVSTYLVTYDSTGKQLDSHQFSCFCDPQKIITGSLDENNVLTMTEYKQEWKFDPEEKGYSGNSVTSREKVSEMYFAIDAKGRFMPSDPPLPVSAKKD